MRPGLEARPTQTERIVALLRSRSPAWVPLMDILNLGIAQYAARIFTARHGWGLNIESRVETVNGEKRSWFRLVKNQPQHSSSGPIGHNGKGSSSETGLEPIGQSARGESEELFDYRVIHRDH